MPLNLKKDEYIKHSANIHLAYFIMPFIFSCIGTFIIYRGYTLIKMYNWWSWKGVTLPIEYVQLPLMAIGVVLTLPFIYLILFNATKDFIITSEKIYIKKGILNTVETEIPLDKINDVKIKAQFFERLFNTGDVIVYTGNEKHLRIDDLVNPYLFKALALREM